VSHGPEADEVRVVVADDHPLFLGALRRTIESCSALTLLAGASDGQEALDMIRLHRPDVAVLDMRMPRLDGREVMRRLREDQPVTRVLFISEYIGGELVLQALTAGAAGYLPKSSSPEEICDAIVMIARGESVLPAEIGTELAGTLRDRGQSGMHLTARELGVLALIAALWLGSSFWGALDTGFDKIYHGPSRGWLKQKRFAISMLFVVLLFMVATVAIPTVQSLLRAGANRLPFDLADVAWVVYAGSLAFSLVLLFGCLVIIYSRVPHLKVPWRAVWPGALGATAAIAVVDYAFPAYLSHISTIAHFGTTIVFVLIMLGWFYVLALILLGGAIVNAMRLTPAGPADAEPR